jgi:hypothetical protein
MSAVMDTLKAKCEELSAEVKKQADFINQASNALKQLRAERKVALAKIQEYNGGILAYSSTLRLMEAGQAPSVVAPTEASVVEETKVVEGETVPDNGAVMD